MLTKEFMEKTIRAYFDACNTGSAEAVMAYFTSEGTHYFPEGSPFGTLRGARAIGDCWARCVRDLGSFWTVDNFVGDPETGKAVIEWQDDDRYPTSGRSLRLLPGIDQRQPGQLMVLEQPRQPLARSSGITRQDRFLAVFPYLGEHP